MKRNQNLILILKTYLLVLSIFSIFRIILFLTELDRVNLDEVNGLTIMKSFIMGLRFDTVISGYILFIPAFLLFTFDIFQYKNTKIRAFLFYWVFVLFAIAFIISAADIPYFNQFYERFSIGAFAWIKNIGFVVSMIMQEPKYFLIMLPLIGIEIVFFIVLRRIFRTIPAVNKTNIFLKITLSLFVLLIMFAGIRGRIQKKSTIRIGTAYFSDNSFLNQLGLNPVFTFMRSYLDSKDSGNKTVNLMDDELAIAKVQHYLGINNPNYNSPIARMIQPDTLLESKPNIVLIIMEGMSAAKMMRHGNDYDLTPFLDSLSNNSIYFENIYTAGKHTHNGVFSTLFSFPAIYRQHALNHILEYDGISSELLKNGYSTTYITTHDSQFDNVEGFLRANGFQNIVSQKDYPLSEVKTALGVPDDYMFKFSIPIINKLTKEGKPFFVTFMTASDHGPYYVPKYFQPKTKEIKQQIIEYADWSLKKFITLCSNEEWFENTIFVFVADHGAAINASYDIPLNYFHTPLIFFAPKLFEQNITYKKIGCQIDIYPTIMGLIKQPYVNNTLGINLINQNREYAIINYDDKIGILDTNYFCILKSDDYNLQLYKYREKDRTNYFEQNKAKAIEMAEYAKANMQVYQRMILNRETKLNNRADGTVNRH